MRVAVAFLEDEVLCPFGEALGDHLGVEGIGEGWISTTDTSGSRYLRLVTLLEAIRERVEATREQRSPKGHDSLSAVLREASAGALHPNADDRLRGSFDDARPDGAVRGAFGRVRHSSLVGLVGEEVDGRVEVFTRASRFSRSR